jgi:hypothetical protein
MPEADEAKNQDYQEKSLNSTAHSTSRTQFLLSAGLNSPTSSGLRQ